MRSALFLLILAFFLVGCQEVEPNLETFETEIDIIDDFGFSYESVETDSGWSLNYEVRNRTGRTVYLKITVLSGCGQVLKEVKTFFTANFSQEFRPLEGEERPCGGISLEIEKQGR